MKKILYIAVSSQTGGVPKHILNALMENQSYEITVAVPADGDYYLWFQKLAFDMIDLPLKPFSLRSLLRLRQYVIMHHIDLIHSHGKGAGMYARPLKLLCPGVKVVHTFHGIYLEQYGIWIKQLYLCIERLLRHLSDVLICVSESERAEALRLNVTLDNRTVVIPNGVELQKFERSNIDQEVYRTQIGCAADDYLIGCVARLEAMKGHKYLIEAFEAISLRHPKCHLLLVGDGPDRAYIETLIQKKHLEDRIHLTGFRHDIPEILQVLDLFVSCSLKEGMPYTLIEAIASGTPVVATDVIGNRDVIQDGINGMLAKSQDSADIADKIETAMEHPERCRQYSEHGIRDVQEKFTIEKTVGQIVAVYEGALR
ncbi:MAG: glycosyltransferase family 4 protein [Hungatella sp.]